MNVELDYEQSDGGNVGPVPGDTLTPEDIKELAVTQGDGLYKDEYEDGKYTYKGANPNNYITFNNETWRIISIGADNTIKIMRNESIGNQVWDTFDSSNWDRPSDIKTYLNEEYLTTIIANQDKIVSHTWSIGRVTENNSDLANQINDENGIQSQSVSVGMITISEYLRANTNTEQCGGFSLNNTNNTTCRTTNWMQSIVPSGGYLWTISPSVNTGFYVFRVYGTAGNAGRLARTNADRSYGVSPTLYLSSDTLLQGTGTQSDPYVITT